MKAPSRVDFIARPRWPAAGVLLAALGVAVLAWQATQTWQEVELLQRQRVGLAGLQRQAVVRAVMSPADIKRHGQVEALMRYLATPWGQLLGLFEERAPAGIVLLKFESDAGTGRVEITGHAAASKALGEFVVALEADKRLSGVLLHQHRVMRDEPGAPIEFTLGASWGAVSAPAPPAASASEAVQ